MVSAIFPYKFQKGGIQLKQFIVMSAMIILGIFIAGLVFNLRDNAENLNAGMITAIDGIQAQVSGTESTE